MLLQITQNHIKNGSKQDTHSCPIALALKDNIKGHLYCAEYDFIHIHQSDRVIRYIVPKNVKQFMKDFVNNKVVVPFTVELSLVVEENL